MKDRDKELLLEVRLVGFVSLLRKKGALHYGIGIQTQYHAVQGK